VVAVGGHGHVRENVRVGGRPRGGSMSESVVAQREQEAKWMRRMTVDKVSECGGCDA
jgi:hypothetical protein